jgi:hypothetical protein
VLRGVLLILLLAGALVCLSPQLGRVCAQDGMIACGP